MKDGFLRQILLPAILVLVPSEADLEQRIECKELIFQVISENASGGGMKWSREGNSEGWVSEYVTTDGQTLIPLGNSETVCRTHLRQRKRHKLTGEFTHQFLIYHQMTDFLGVCYPFDTLELPAYRPRARVRGNSQGESYRSLIITIIEALPCLGFCDHTLYQLEILLTFKFILLT